MDDLFYSPEGLKKFSDIIYDSNKKFIKSYGRKGRKVWNKMSIAIKDKKYLFIIFSFIKFKLI